ncbi:MAG: hypothetical protein H7Y02_09855, partial [Candidatus Obscuribacterales bacterium]|nr:hypothetical protein [Steroidobacteraceae bacterium]
AKEFVPPTLAEWLEFWDDDDTEIGNLRNLEYWLSTSRVASSHRSVRSGTVGAR